LFFFETGYSSSYKSNKRNLLNSLSEPTKCSLLADCLLLNPQITPISCAIALLRDLATHGTHIRTLGSDRLFQS